MLWMVAFGCLLAGALIGAFLYKLLRSDETRVQQLEMQLQSLGDEYENYKKEVHGHFSDSAVLIGKLTDSYREVYQHMAHGARNLCPDHIAVQLTQLSPTDSLTAVQDRSASANPENVRLSPPLDYVIPDAGTDRTGTARA
jgi:uncharacterized membrane-anchored protein YhcB (DUF1043 family)